MLAAQDVAARCKELGINALHIKIRATGGKFNRVSLTITSILINTQVTVPRPPVPVLSPLSVLLPVLACALDVSRMLLLPHPTRPGGRVVAVVVVSEHVRKDFCSVVEYGMAWYARFMVL